MPDDLAVTLFSEPLVLGWPFGAPEDRIEPATVLAVLRALAAMARASGRHEADVTSSLLGVGLALNEPQRDAVLQQLEETGWITRVIHLIDGGVLVIVTGLGLNRASRI